MVAGSAQAVFTPTQNPLLPGETDLSGRAIETRALYLADTNVRPLQRKASAADHDATRGYLISVQAYEARLRWQRWELAYAYGLADWFEGNRGAARLFLESEQRRLRQHTRYPVEATLNRSAVNCWTLTYRGDLAVEAVRLRYHIGVSYLHLQRVQQGRLQGQKEGDAFAGELTLLTTRGVPATRIGGYGYAAHAGIALQTNRWGVSLSVENLWSHLRVRTAQRINATVRVNQLTPDADGFLRAPPLLEGRVSDQALERAARPRTEIALWQRDGARRFGVIAAHHADWRLAMALRWDVHGGALWMTYWQPYPMMTLGYESARWRITLGLDTLQPNMQRRLYGEFCWRIPLE